jgi:interleukin-1 receptor-associated kinase 1
VHFDIKPHNIQLDHDLRPKISDSRLAKLFPQKESTIAVSTAGARVTIGYIAPNVFLRGIGAITSNSEVYSYNMMALEMSRARRSMDDDEVLGSETSSSSKYFPQCLYKALDQLCARACEIDGEATELMRKMVVVGLLCVQTSPLDRPSMSKVVEMMENTEELQLPPRGP